MSDENSSPNPPSSEPHPGAKLAYDYITSIPQPLMNDFRREFVKQGAAGNEWALKYIDTLNAVQAKQPLSERDLMGTAFVMMSMEADE